MPLILRGDGVLDETIAASSATLRGRTVVIVEPERQASMSDTQHLAALVSASAKCDALRRAGLRVETPSFDGKGNAFAGSIADWNGRDDVAGVILQRPCAPALQRAAEALAPAKDLDAVWPRHGMLSATAEATCRVIDAFARRGDRVAVVGGRGSVGRDVLRGLFDRGFETLCIDADDDLLQVRDTAAIVSAAGHPWLLGIAHLRSHHRLIIDIGFTPLSLFPLEARGDVDPAAWPSDAVVTPVPGGVGPLQIAVLLERIRGVSRDWNLPRHLTRA
jgi:methylenetetrahydrofolate dehydrogenase (NADP+) / methenyltetrahydrofolate cyclohydrolase